MNRIITLFLLLCTSLPGADPEQLRHLLRGPDHWNEWRKQQGERFQPDLRDSNLMDVSLSGANLQRANLSHTELSMADLSHAILTEARLTGAILRNAGLRHADLTGARLEGVDFLDADLSSTDLRDANLTDADLGGTDLSDAVLRNADLSFANLTGTDLSDADFTGASLVRVRLEGTDLSYENLSGVDLRHAYLNAANLSAADLSEADLSEADLSNTNLSDANLNGTDLHDANLRGAEMTGANLANSCLTGTDLAGVDLSNRSFAGFDLSDTDLTDANLSKTDLTGSNLTDAKLHGTDLRMAKLFNADLGGAFYEPRSDPEVKEIAGALGLETLRFTRQYSGNIVRLKSSLHSAGYTSAVRRINAAIRNNTDATWERVALGWTCAYGTDWTKPLWLIGLSWLGFNVAYFVGLQTRGNPGLYMVVRRVKGNGQEFFRRRRLEYVADTPEAMRRRNSSVNLEWRAWGTAAFFSAMSAFNIGFREFNFARWIRLVQPRPFEIEARGWVRTVSGAQALLSLYLIALALLSYFGASFEKG